MSTPRRTRGRASSGVVPAALITPGLALLGVGLWHGAAGTAPPQPPLGPHVVEVRAAAGEVAPSVGPGLDRHDATGQQGAERAGGVRVVVDDPVAVSVPSLDLHAPLVDLGLDEQGRLEVPADADKAGWWTGGPAPGEVGAAVLAGHVDSALGPAVFWRLGELVPGDRVVVHDGDGTALTFVVEDVGRWPKDQFPTEAVYLDADGAELRLITCGGEFDRRAGSYRDNVVVFATAA